MAERRPHEGAAESGGPVVRFTASGSAGGGGEHSHSARPIVGRGESPRISGLVTLYVAAAHTPGAAACAALAVLLRSCCSRLGARFEPDRECLLVEASNAAGAAQAGYALRRTVRVAASGVQRTTARLGGARRRDWVLLLHACRTTYNETAVATGGFEPHTHGWLAQLADRSVVVTGPGKEALSEARATVRSLRDAGASCCECLWLDAA